MGAEWLGLLGVALGVLLTQGFHRLDEDRRARREDTTRFHAERRVVYGTFYSSANAIRAANRMMTQLPPEAFAGASDALIRDRGEELQKFNNPVGEINIVASSGVRSAANDLYHPLAVTEEDLPHEKWFSLRDAFIDVTCLVSSDQRILENGLRTAPC